MLKKSQVHGSCTWENDTANLFPKGTITEQAFHLPT
jgi:hypothetical protein